MSIPQPGEVWIDLRPMTDRREWRDGRQYRRIVAVTAFYEHGFAEGLSSWQEKTRRGWTAMEYPPARKTRINAGEFLRRFYRAEESDHA